MRRIPVLAPLLALAFFAFATGGGRPRAAVAAPLLDANYDVPVINLYAPSGNWLSQGQSFTVLHTGRLVRAGFKMSNHSGSAVNVTFEIRTLDASGLATATVISSVTFSMPGDTGMNWHEADFATPATVTAGQRYALLVAPVDADIRIWGASSDGYADGGLVTRYVAGGGQTQPPDLSFRTYVEPLTRYALSGTVTPSPTPLNVPPMFAFTVTNAGDTSAVSTLLRVDLPAGFQQSGAMTVLSGGVPVPGASCAVMGGGGLQILCLLGTVPASAVYMVSIPARITNASPGTRHCARAIVSGGVAGVTGMAMTQACTQLAAGLPDLVPSLSCDRFDTADICTITVRNTGASTVTLGAGVEAVAVDMFYTGSPSPGITWIPKAGFTNSSTFVNPGNVIFRWLPAGGQNIPSGGSITFQFAMAGGSGQTYQGTIRVDPASAITELNEGNNAVTIPLTALP